MDEEDDDDIYAPEANDAAFHGTTALITTANVSGTSDEKPQLSGLGDDEEEGEEVEEDGDDSDSDIDIITERKEESKTEPTPAQRVRDVKASAVDRLQSSTDATSRSTPPVAKVEISGKATTGRPGSSYPAIKSSTIDVDAKPSYGPNGKSITDLDMDADFPEDDKPWRRPGTDMTDFFNYGFDEFTWASYCLKQSTLRSEVADTKKQTTDMQSFLTGGMPGMPGMPGAPAVGPPAMPGMAGLGEMPPEMQQMFQSMMAQGMDPMQMDPAQMMQMMQNPQMGDPSQAFGGSSYGPQGQNQQQVNYGNYGGGGSRNQGGRGQNRRW